MQFAFGYPSTRCNSFIHLIKLILSWSSITRTRGKNLLSSLYNVLLGDRENHQVHRIQKIVEGPLVFRSGWFSLEYLLPKATGSSHMQVALLPLCSFLTHLPCLATGSFSLIPKAWMLIVCLSLETRFARIAIL